MYVGPLANTWSAVCCLLQRGRLQQVPVWANMDERRCELASVWGSFIYSTKDAGIKGGEQAYQCHLEFRECPNTWVWVMIQVLGEDWWWGQVTARASGNFLVTREGPEDNQVLPSVV